MNDCVEQVTGGGFPWIILVVAAIVAGVFVYRNGIVGTEASLKALAEKLKARLAKIEAKAAAKKPAAAPAAPANKTTRLAELQGLVIAKTITVDEYITAKAKILAE